MTALFLLLLSAAAPSDPNPLLAPLSGPHGGVPRFDAFKVEQFKPAFERAMAEEDADIDRIAKDPAPPTFENTVAALERAGRAYVRVRTYFNLWSGLLNSPEFQPLATELAPKLSAHEDSVKQNGKLFARLAKVYEARERSGLDPEQQRLVWVDYTNFVLAGAKLDPAGKQRVAEINQRLATLFTTFEQHLLADEDTYLLLEHESDLAGLSPSVRAAAAQAAAAHGHPGQWAIVTTRSSAEPFLSQSDRRDLREKVFKAFIARGDHGDAHDNNQVITEILKLRAQRAKLLGFPTHAHWRVSDRMAKTPEKAMALMEAVWPAAVARVHEEVADMQALANQAGDKLTIEPWDYRYYAEKVRKAKYDLDDSEVKPYLQLEKLREGMFWVAGQLFDLHFKPLTDVPVYHPDVRVWEVTDGAGKRVGIWYFDPWARPGKRSGAWMDEYRQQERFDGEVTSIVSNNANFIKGKPGEPVLISWDDATTLFHEFGHALHGLCSNVRYPTVSGTNVAADYVEFPSQLLERWLQTPEVLSHYAINPQTGKPLPPELLAKIQKAAKFNKGFATVEYLSAALIDMKLHLAGETPIEPRAFERDTLAALGMPREVVMRHRLPQFNHLFADNDYAAGYYSYLWADTLSADAYEAFLEGKGPYDPEVARRLKKYVFSVGNTVDPAEGYRAFRGKDAGIGALMRNRGFPVPPAAN